MSEDELKLINLSKKTFDFLRNSGFDTEILENHSIVAQFGESDLTLVLSPTYSGFVGGAVDCKKSDILKQYKEDEFLNLLRKNGEIDNYRLIGDWVYETKRDIESSRLSLWNRDISYGEIKTHVLGFLKQFRSKNIGDGITLAAKSLANKDIKITK